MIKRFSHIAIAAFIAAGSLLTASAQDGPRSQGKTARPLTERPRQARPAGVSPRAAGDIDGKQLYGLHCESYYGDPGIGIAKIGDGSFSWVKQFDRPAFQGCYMGDKYLAVFYNANDPGNVQYEYFDTANWSSLSKTEYAASATDILPYGLTYDHTSGVVYGCFFQGTTGWIMQNDARFGYISDNPANPTNIIGELPERMRALATDKDGQIYGIGFSGALYKINKFTAATEKLTDLSMPSSDPDLGDNSEPWGTYGRESIAVDWESGYFYMAYGDYNDDTYVARIDITRGTVDIVSDFSYTTGPGTGEIFTGIYFTHNTAVGGHAPAAVSNLTVTPTGTQLKANVSFTLPSEDTDGNKLSGSLHWSVLNGATEIAAGNAQAGSPVSTTVALPAKGLTSFVVYASLNGVNGAPASDSKWIGPDTPVISGKPTLSASGKKVTVSWSAAYSENGGNLDPVRYKVVRMPDRVLVTDQCTDLKATDNIESDYKIRYHYEITPIAGETEGATVESRARYIGSHFQMPFAEDFTDNDRFLLYPVSDNNKDGNSWEINLNSKAAVYQGNSNAADDYLLIGPFKMTASGLYSFRMLAGAHSMTENVAVYTATFGNDGKAAIEEFIPVTGINPMEGDKTLSKLFIPETDGEYYFAISACSNANSKILYIYEVNVSEYSGDLPAMPENVKFIPEAKSATIKFTTPAKNINGNAATGLREARIYRDGNLIGSLSSGISAGTEASFTDTESVSDGNHIYSVSIVNSAGEGPAAEISGYRGLDFPGTPTNLRFWEDISTPGLIHITFDAPEYGYNGGYINNDDISYILDYLVMGGVSGATTIGKGTTHSFQLPMNVTVQNVFAGSIYGSNPTGSLRQSWRTNVCTIGPASTLPIQESWLDMSQKSGLWTGQDIDEDEDLFDSFWNICDGNAFSFKPQDNDGGMLVLTNSVANRGHRILSPRITLEGTANPTVVFYYLYTACAREFSLEIIVEDQTIRTLRSIDIAGGNTGKWIRCEVPLKEFIGKKYIQLAFSGYGDSDGAVIAIDNISISDFAGKDLAVKGFSGPSRGNINEDLQFSLRVRNNGAAKVAAGDYSILFYKNGEMIDEIPGREIGADSELTIELTDTPVVTDPASSDYRAEISYEPDGNASNNKSQNISVRIITPNYPTVTDLSGKSMNGVTLQWSDPSTSDMPGTQITESFESYDAFSISNIGEWTLLDNDKQKTVILALETGVLDYPNIGQPMAWQVFNPTQAGIPFESWVPRTGSNLLASFQACVNNQRNFESDDWLISPELNGSQQVISFYARAAMSAYSPEIFDFMISSESNNAADFQPLETDVEVPYTKGLEWTEFSYTVPAGTRYFAIVHKSFDRLVMLLDDITYIPAGSQPISLELQGFNVYRDGKLVNSELVTENEYADTETEEGQDYTYAVTAVWDKGESALSNTVVVKAKASIECATGTTLTITATDGGLRIDGGNGEYVQVYNIAGLYVGAATAQGSVFIPTPGNGLYLVKAGGKVAKIAVR